MLAGLILTRQRPPQFAVGGGAGKSHGHSGGSGGGPELRKLVHRLVDEAVQARRAPANLEVSLTPEAVTLTAGQSSVIIPVEALQVDGIDLLDIALILLLSEELH